MRKRADVRDLSLPSSAAFWNKRGRTTRLAPEVQSVKLAVPLVQSMRELPSFRLQPEQVSKVVEARMEREAYGILPRSDRRRRRSLAMELPDPFRRRHRFRRLGPRWQIVLWLRTRSGFLGLLEVRANPMRLLAHRLGQVVCRARHQLRT